MNIKKKFSAFKAFSARFIKSEEASVIPLIAMSFPVLLGMVGLGTDASLWMANKRSLQTAADAAALAASWELAQDSAEYMDAAALKEAINNGYNASNNGVLDVTVSEGALGTVVSVSLSQDAETFFSQILFDNPVRITATAEALMSGAGGNYCILALENEDDGAVTSHGSVEVNMPDCGIASNSTDDASVSVSGNVDIDVDTLRTSGDVEVTGGSADLSYNTLQVGASQLDDPYEDLEIEEYEECSGRSRGTSVNTSTTLSPGVFCGGLSISGNVDVEFEPGVYVIDGGDFDVTGSGSLYGEGVTFVLTGSGSDYAQLDISGSKSIEFSAPDEGEPYEGVVFFQDRDAPVRDNLQNKIVGTADIVMNGVAYFPSQGLWFGGDASFSGADSPCTKLIARTVTLAGNPLLGNNCDGMAVADIGNPNVRLLR